MKDNKSKLINNILLVIVIVLLLITINTNSKVSDLENQVNSLSYIFDMISEIDSSVDNLYLALDEENSIISEYTLSEGEVDFENATMQLEYSVTPKQTSENTKVYLVTNDNEMLEMQSNGAMEFILTYEADLSNFDGMKQVVIENDDIKQSETISEFEFFNAIYYLISGVDIAFNGDITSNENSELNLNGELTIQTYNKNQDVEVKSAQLQVFAGDELVNTYDLNETNSVYNYNELIDNESASTEVGDVNIFDYYATFIFDDFLLEVTHEQNYQVCVVLTFDNGFTHNLELIDSYGSEENIYAYVNTENEGILYSPSGEIIVNNND